MLCELLRLGATFLVLAAALQRPGAGRIVAVADVHGNLDALAAILRESGLIDSAHRWSGGAATLVQLGDLIDRGPRSREVLDFLMALQKEAADRGGSVRVALGNHEVMNIMGDLRFVVPADYAAFADGRSEQRRQSALREFVRFEARKGITTDEAAWLKAHPPGFIEHREAFGPQGKYGKWLRSLPVVHRVGDALFLHGGLNPSLKLNVNQINEAVRREFQAFDAITRHLVGRRLALPFFRVEEFVSAAQSELDRIKGIAVVELTDSERAYQQSLELFVDLGSWLSVHDEGPLWFRGYDRWPEPENEEPVASLLARLEARRIIVGHTIQLGRQIRSRFGGKVFLVDTALMLGSPAALEILEGRVRAIYPGRRIDLD